jgi:hypothetical protein
MNREDAKRMAAAALRLQKNADCPEEYREETKRVLRRLQKAEREATTPVGDALRNQIDQYEDALEAVKQNDAKLEEAARVIESMYDDEEFEVRLA